MSWYNKLSVLILVATTSFTLGCSDEDGTSEEKENIAVVKQKLSGNINPEAIQIDGPSAGADLYANVGTPLNSGATADWVADSDPNLGTGCLRSDGIATCIEPGITGARAGVGHWNGLRIVDGISGDDQDIFLTGGKENDVKTWNVGPGSVGSSKYDLIQAYLANNQTNLYFGMERSGNNGTTAFDFEFNQVAPMSRSTCVQSPLVPCRTTGDVLFTFEMQGSGNTGSATPHIYTWNGSVYVEGAANGILSSINNSTTTAGPPWGHVDSHGAWVLGNIERFTFAEAVAPVSLLPGVNNCGGKAFVQVRTRSSSTATSDLKDTSKVFEFVFNSVSGEAKLSPTCDDGLVFKADVMGPDGNPVANPTCKWTFSNGMSSDKCSGYLDNVAPGSYTATVEVSDSDSSTCKQTATSNSVNVLAPLSVVADLSATCNSSFNYSATVSGGSGTVNYSWTFTGSGANPSSSSSQSGSVSAGAPGTSYTGTVVATDTRSDIVCTATASDSAVPLAPLNVNLNLQSSAMSCPMSSDAATYAAAPSGGNGNYLLVWSNGSCSGSTCVVNPSDSLFCANQSLSVVVSDSSGLCSSATSETETYSKTTTVVASDNP